VTYDPTVVRYDQLLQVLFSVIADPTLKDRQGPRFGHPVPRGDRADVERAAHRGDQLPRADAFERGVGQADRGGDRILPAVLPGRGLSQDFADKNPTHPYIRRWDAPKVTAFRARYPSMYRVTFPNRVIARPG
jgi:peptide-methionine (S)-S-oxide reductase